MYERNRSAKITSKNIQMTTRATVKKGENIDVQYKNSTKIGMKICKENL